jgi:lipopolysaccharide export system permease protein
MKLLKKYLSLTLGQTFFPLFFTLYSITSIITLVKIVSLTSVITMNFTELLYLYALNIPNILLYTLPVTFFIAVILNMSKLSSEYEMIVLTSFGLSPLKILNFLLPISLLVSISLLVLTLITIPQAKYLEQNFITTKKQNAQFNIKPSEYGQKFGPWNIYVEKKIKNNYQNITLLQPEDTSDTIIFAKSATIENNIDSLKLNLFDGSSTIIADNIKQVDFKKMTMNNILPKAKQISSFDDLIVYWSNIQEDDLKRKMLMKNLFLSMLPFISLIFYIALGYYNPRYQKNKATIISIGLIVLYIVVMSKFAAMRNLNLLLLLPFLWIIISIIIYRIRVKPYY